MVMGWRAYERSDPLKSPEMDLIGRYLECDVKSLWMLHRFLMARGGGPEHTYERINETRHSGNMETLPLTASTPHHVRGVYR
jgi:hypothetical protein